MQETLKCDFELSKLLKKLGYQGETHEAYINTDLCNNNFEDMTESDYFKNYYTYSQNHNSKPHRISVPTCYEAKIWLFSMFNIYVNVKPIFVDGGVKWIGIEYENNNIYIKEEIFNKLFDSHDECFMYYLKLCFNYLYSFKK